MVIPSGLFVANVFHKRFSPKENAFNYKLYYFSIFLKDASRFSRFRLLSKDQLNFFSLYEKDYGFPSFKPFEGSLQNIINKQDHPFEIKDILLITLPRVLGYAFNPISFWFCFDNFDNLKAVFCEVNNTFGERHGYFCMKNDGSGILKDDLLKSKKAFHVSPFYTVEGDYEFRFHVEQKQIGIWIDYYISGSKTLSTSLVGIRRDLSDKSLLMAFFRYPFVTLKVIILIHYQAIKLYLKNVTYKQKPPPPKNEITK